MINFINHKWIKSQNILELNIMKKKKRSYKSNR